MIEKISHECDLCFSQSDDVKHLPLYVHGSESIWACLQCRIVLTTVANGMIRAAGRAKLALARRKHNIAATTITFSESQP